MFSCHHDHSSHKALRQAERHQVAGNWIEAAASYVELARSHPQDHRLLANQGNALWLADLPEAAHHAYERALVLLPSCSVSRRGRASCLRDLNRFEEALELHRQLACELARGSAEGQANLWAHSQILIGLELYGQAFQRMASRRAWSLGGRQLPWRLLAPRLTLVSEQGFGDSLQYVRFLLPLLHQRLQAGLCDGVCLLVEAALVDLFREGLAWVANTPQVDAQPPTALDRDVLTLVELPGAMGLQHLPAIRPDGAYLRSPLWTTTASSDPPEHAFQIGLVSAAGLPGADPFCMREYQKRTLPVGVLWRLVCDLRHRGALVFDLQYGADGVRHRALGLEPLPSEAGLEGFADTARVVAGLDLVITVDTAMAHLMGALGRSCWVLLPWSADPRWLRHGSVSPWYPCLRLFRQPRPGDWHGAVDQLLKSFIPIHFNPDQPS